MIDGHLMNEINEAAAQGKQTLAPEKCQTCGGDGWTKLNGQPFNDCPKCQGTGK